MQRTSKLHLATLYPRFHLTSIFHSLFSQNLLANSIRSLREEASIYFFLFELYLSCTIQGKPSEKDRVKSLPRIRYIQAATSNQLEYRACSCLVRIELDRKISVKTRVVRWTTRCQGRTGPETEGGGARWSVSFPLFSADDSLHTRNSKEKKKIDPLSPHFPFPRRDTLERNPRDEFENASGSKRERLIAQ